MCELRRTLAAGALALVALVSATAAHAQEVPAPGDRAQLIARIHRLDAEAREAFAAAQQAEAAAMEVRRGEKQDTVRVGPLLVVTTPSQAEEARQLWGDEWTEMSSLLGEKIDRTTKLGRNVFTYDRSPRTHEYLVQANWRAVAFHTPVSNPTVRRAIRSTIGAAISATLPEDLFRWGGILPVGEPTPPTVVYRAFVRAPTALAQSCVQGSQKACWAALGEMDPSADVNDVWYTADEARAIASTLDQRSSEARACAAHSDAACRQVMKERTQSNVWPFPPAVRSSLLWFALQRGGPGALDRLVESVEADDTKESWARTDAGSSLGAMTHVREHLGRAANMDPDVLIGLWRDQVMSGRAGAPTPDRPTRGNVLVWITLLGACAARSTRWRLG